MDGLTQEWRKTAARAALKRKKQHEQTLEQTSNQISMLEQQIYSIESANINQETLAAMKNAGAAMKAIHGKMTMEDVDATMYFPLFPLLLTIEQKLTAGPKKGKSARTGRADQGDRQRHHLDAHF